MDLILIRHAEAEPGYGCRDADRALTDVGHEQAARLAVTLNKRCKPKVVVHSPYLRAIQTAAPLAVDVPKFETDLLLPEADRFKKLTEWLTRHGDGPIAVVGHNPSISYYLSWLLAAEAGATAMEKAAVAAVQLHKLGKGGGQLLWFVTPDWCG